MSTNDQPHAEVTEEMRRLVRTIIHIFSACSTATYEDAAQLLADFVAKREAELKTSEWYKKFDNDFRDEFVELKTENENLQQKLESLVDEQAVTGDHNLVPSLQTEISLLTASNEDLAAQVVKLTERAQMVEARLESLLKESERQAGVIIEQHDLRQLATRLAEALSSYVTRNQTTC